MKTIDAYKKILKVIENCAKEVKLDSCVDINYSLKRLIIREQIQESFGIDLSHCHNYDDTFFKVGEDQYIAKYGEKHNGTIAWPDDGKQPKNEWLFVISYPCGAYTFGDIFNSYYPEDVFKQYFEELKAFSPKYIDTANKTLYFADDVAKVVYENVDSVFKKYKAIAEENRKASKIEALRKQLQELEK